MNQELKTIEVAKIYESQGYFQEALEIYSFLNDTETSFEARSGLKRMEAKKGDALSCIPEPPLSLLCQEWLGLVALEKRLELFKRIQSHPL